MNNNRLPTFFQNFEQETAYQVSLAQYAFSTYTVPMIEHQYLLILKVASLQKL